MDVTFRGGKIIFAQLMSLTFCAEGQRHTTEEGLL